MNAPVINLKYKENGHMPKEDIKKIDLKDNTNDKIFYLDQNIEELKKKKTIKSYLHIQHSNKFPNDEYEKYFKKRYYNFYDKNHTQFFDAFFLEMKQMQPICIQNIGNLSIINTNVDIDHIYTKCTINLFHSQLNSYYSIFIPQNLDETDYVIQISYNSNATFKNCHFYDAKKIAVFVNNNSNATFENCIFENNFLSCIVSNGSTAKFINCKFINDKHISLYLSNSKCETIDCEFLDIEGKAVFLAKSSELHIANTDFVNCEKGAIKAKNSKLNLNNIIIHNSNNTALFVDEKSQIFANCVAIEETNGNAIQIIDSTGYIINCNISGTIYTTIAVIGCDSNPIFYNCKLNDNRHSFCVLCKNGSRPLFDHCSFADCTSNCFSILTFSRPHIQNCYFENINKFYISAYSGSHITFNNIESGNVYDLSNKINVKKSAKFEYKTYDDVEKEIYQFKSENGDYQNQWMKLQKIPLQYLKKISSDDITNVTKNSESTLKCSHCHKEMNDKDQIHMITNCGHLYCNNCININRCSICDVPANNIQKLFLENECVICLDKKPNTISLPCGHVCMCYECALKISEKKFKCPMCNQLVDNYQFIFNDIESKF